MKFVLLLIISTFCFLAQAAPESFEFWFLSPPKSAHLNFEEPVHFSRKFATNTKDLECKTKVGDDCFDPKFGIFPDPELVKLKDAQKKLQEEKNKPIEDKYISNIETTQIDCSKESGWDIYCGKTQKEEKKKARLEVWVDISRSMSDIDYPDKNGDCFRKSFIKRIKESCSSIDISVFHSHLKELGDMKDLCGHVGFSEQNRLLAWINESKANRVIIITTKTLATKGVSDFIELKGGRSKGDAHQKELSGKDLLDLVDSTKKLCR